MKNYRYLIGVAKMQNELGSDKDVIRFNIYDNEDADNLKKRLDFAFQQAAEGNKSIEFDNLDKIIGSQLFIEKFIDNSVHCTSEYNQIRTREILDGYRFVKQITSQQFNIASPKAEAYYSKRKNNANAFAQKMLPIIEELKQNGATSLNKIAIELTRKQIPTQTGGSRWYSRTVCDLIKRQLELK